MNVVCANMNPEGTMRVRTNQEAQEKAKEKQKEREKKDGGGGGDEVTQLGCGSSNIAL
jgi:hypothetical protein